MIVFQDIRYIRKLYNRAYQIIHYLINNYLFIYLFIKNI